MDTNSSLREEEFRKEQRDSTCVTEPQQWQEERQAQLCLARMAAVVPDTCTWEARTLNAIMHVLQMTSNH